MRDIVVHTYGKIDHCDIYDIMHNDVDELETFCVEWLNQNQSDLSAEDDEDDESICTLALAGEGIVANDPKGELYHYTHEMLESLGYTIRVLDFNSPKKSDRYYPLQMIIDAYNDGRVDDAQTYAWDFVTFIVEKNEHSEPI